MERVLADQITPPPSPERRPKTIRRTDLPDVDICLLGPVGFYRNMIQPETEVFTSSLYEIDQMLDCKQSLESPSELTDEELVERNLPATYQDFADVFSKTASDVLPPHRPYDHKIQLEANNTLGYSPLY